MNRSSISVFTESLTSNRLRSPRTRSRARCTTCRQAASLLSMTEAICG